MFREVAKLILYGDLSEDSILFQLGEIFRRFESRETTKEELMKNCYTQIKRLLETATDYGFDHNLWQNYLTFLLITNENPFSIVCEKTGAGSGSVNAFAKNDFKVFLKLFHFDFSAMEKELEIDCFSHIASYQAIPKKELMYNKNVSEKVQELSEKLAHSKDEEEFFNHVTDFYKKYGVGMFGLNKAFRILSSGSDISFQPINNMERVLLCDLVGYDYQKKQLVSNTEDFVNGKRANNVLLYGDSGTGKSTSIKAIVNEYYDKGLRMIEIYKHQFQDLSAVIAKIKNRNYRFVIYMDDLSFEEFEIEYKFLKAVIEGGVETRPENILIYATSNRRHLIRETWNDRSDMEHGEDVHRSDTMEEKLSLANRFGVAINYGKPSRQEYFNIVITLAKRLKLPFSEETLCAEATKWEMMHGGISGRTAQQFINSLSGKTE